MERVASGRLGWASRRGARAVVRIAVFAGVGLSLWEGAALALGAGEAREDSAGPTRATTVATGTADALGAYVVMGYNDLGMHCMNDDFSEIVVLPPFNNLHATVIRRGVEPEIMTGDVSVRYWIPSNTESASKTNFWRYAPALFGVSPAPNVGLTGHGMSGTMTPTGNNDWSVTGIPITPTEDTGRENPYPLATIRVVRNGSEVARTQAVVPVSTELSCDLCHNAVGISVATDILRRHDTLHGTGLETMKPVLCASCHSSNALGTPGVPGVASLSSSMHSAHAARMGPASGLASECYACHPGIRTACQRDIHLAKGMRCSECHGSMADVGDPSRRPWIDEPRCGSCHARPGFAFEESGKLFRESRGHSGVQCAACHGSPHAITPTVTEVDNLQAIALQGHAGTIDTCAVCHTTPPSEGFFHRINEGDSGDAGGGVDRRVEMARLLSASLEKERRDAR